MINSACPECKQPVTSAMVACSRCGHPLARQETWTTSPANLRRPYFQYALVAFAAPVSLYGLSRFLAMQGIPVSEDVLGVGLALGTLGASILLLISFIDRTFVNRDKPAAPLHFVSWFSLGVVVLTALWLLVAIFAERVGFKLDV